VSDFLASLGALGFTYRLRRLSDRMQDGARRLYDTTALPLEPNWHVLLLFLERRGPVSVMETAAALRVSHPAVIELARRMEIADLVQTTSDPLDGRRRMLRLSPEGRRRLPAFRDIWQIAAEELESLIETTAGGDALASLAVIEAELDEAELDVRINHRLEAAHPEQVRSDVGGRATIRALAPRDRAAVLHIARELVRTSDTYAFDPDVTDDELWSYWRPDRCGAGYGAEMDGELIGVFVIRPNLPGPGAHVANASYAVRADVRGTGLGRQMGAASLRIAADLGYRAMRFNTVVATNVRAVRLWRSLGFRIVGTIPEGFRLPDGDYAAQHIMYRTLP
jgi:DNA-binding MarR family transcriptional regulator/L-amino acid N-acyltransferase YncA